MIGRDVDSALVADVPAVAESFGEGLGESAALDALTQNDEQPGAESDTDDDAGENIPTRAGATVAERAPPNAVPPSDLPKRGPGRPPGQGPSKRKLATMSKKTLVDLYVAEREKAAEQRARTESLAQDVQAYSALSADVIDESIGDMAEDVIGLADAGAQLWVGERYAEAVALEDREMARLKMLAARVARVRGGAALAKAAPEVALGLALACVALSKLIAYKIAAREHGGR